MNRKSMSRLARYLVEVAYRHRLPEFHDVMTIASKKCELHVREFNIRGVNRPVPFASCEPNR